MNAAKQIGFQLDKQALDELIVKYWKDYVKYRSDAAVVKPSIPIIWFGDMDAYLKSPKRIVTVGHNPSFNEFLESKKTGDKEKKKQERMDFKAELRLKNAEKLVGLDENGIRQNLNVLKDAYNGYFGYHLYPTFFKAFNTVLQNLPGDAIACYADIETARTLYTDTKGEITNEYHKTSNRAIHIDLHTALATKEQWNRYIKKVEATKSLSDFLREDNKEEWLFTQLVNILNPEIILFTSNKDTLDRLVGKDNEGEIRTISGKKRIGCKYKGRLLIYGEFAQNPFGCVSNASEEHKKILKKIFDEYGTWK